MIRLKKLFAFAATFVTGALFAIAALWGYSYWIYASEAAIEGDVSLSLEREEKYLARQWLKENENDSALASNRFGSTENATKYVERLYALGAKDAYVSGILSEPERIAQENGPYATSIIIELPLDQEKRTALFGLVKAESLRQGFSPELDYGQKYVFLWWD